ncbi:Histone-lysine N-methyltransferase SETMAR [Ooceraea biroi]|uniref:Histone-lysine N-methyltransferase SETMAR n=1 Tax=Ooceraea biroi TaxID=2015173 RepID=A0A026VYH8_OOCBI|nr:Histone-lysine N-methyltransferase SETMAR [Ooceraea biroi]
MEENKEHFRHLMFFYYQKGKNASQATNSICSVYGEGALAERTVRKWFAKFRAGDFNLKDQERSSRPSTTDDDQIKTLIENNPRYTTRELTEILKISKTTVHDHVVKLGYVSRYDVWVPHNLAEKNLMDPISRARGRVSERARERERERGRVSERARARGRVSERERGRERGREGERERERDERNYM